MRLQDAPRSLFMQGYINSIKVQGAQSQLMLCKNTKQCGASCQSISVCNNDNRQTARLSVIGCFCLWRINTVPPIPRSRLSSGSNKSVSTFSLFWLRLCFLILVSETSAVSLFYFIFSIAVNDEYVHCRLFEIACQFNWSICTRTVLYEAYITLS